MVLPFQAAFQTPIPWPGTDQLESNSSIFGDPAKPATLSLAVGLDAALQVLCPPQVMLASVEIADGALEVQ